MRFLVNLEQCVCAFTSKFPSLPAKEEGETVAAYTHVLCKSCTWVLLQAAPGLWQPVGSVSFVCGGAVAAIPARLRYGLNLQTGKQQPHPSSAWDGDPQVSVPWEAPNPEAAGGGGCV